MIHMIFNDFDRGAITAKNHVVIIHNREKNDLLTETVNFVNENCNKGKSHYQLHYIPTTFGIECRGIIFSFEKKEDAAIFKMRFG